MKNVAIVSMAALLAVAAASARADELKSWTVDMTVVLKDDAGLPMKDQFEAVEDPQTHARTDCSKCPPLTLGGAVAHSLFFVMPDERDATPEQKWAWALLATRIKADPAARLSAAESNLIYQRLGKTYSGFVLMEAMPLIDPNRKPPEIK